jgi:hypothetical protein
VRINTALFPVEITEVLVAFEARCVLRMVAFTNLKLKGLLPTMALWQSKKRFAVVVLVELRSNSKRCKALLEL